MKFSKAELDFIRKELQIEANETEENEEILEQIWEGACQIEIKEANQFQEMSPIGDMAASLVTKLGEK